jgi:hypothetical protein
VVTSVRRIGARRAAGPPVLPRHEEPTTENHPEEVLAGGHPVEEPAHVPVKKRGSRKR